MNSPDHVGGALYCRNLPDAYGLPIAVGGPLATVFPAVTAELPVGCPQWRRSFFHPALTSLRLIPYR
jgi:hypothetical protein